MRRLQYMRVAKGLAAAQLLLFMFVAPISLLAQTSSSNSYQVEEAQFGSGGEVESCSAGQYCAQSSLGANAVGEQSSANFGAQAGFLTSNAPYLEFVISTSSVELGNLDSATTATGTANFYVRSYINGAYSVVTLSDTLTSEGGEQLDQLLTPAAATPGTEQFGINLVDNSSPNIGTNPVNVPDNTFADGEAAPGYDTVDQFKYVAGDTIARSAATPGNPANGQTNYTISYIANISGVTPAGTYVMNHDIVVLATF